MIHLKPVMEERLDLRPRARVRQHHARLPVHLVTRMQRALRRQFRQRAVRKRIPQCIRKSRRHRKVISRAKRPVVMLSARVPKS